VNSAMSIALYMDENVHGAITNGLRQRNVDVLTVSIGTCVRDLEIISRLGEPGS
jgi:hypothetical protein